MMAAYYACQNKVSCLWAVVILLPTVSGLAIASEPPLGKEVFERIAGMGGVKISAQPIDLAASEGEVVVECGDLWKGTQYSLSFDLVNNSGKPIEIADVVLSCGCLKGATKSNVVVNGERTEQQIRFNSGPRESFSETVTFSYGDPKTSKKVVILGRCFDRAEWNVSEVKNGLLTINIAPRKGAGNLLNCEVYADAAESLTVQGITRKEDGSMAVSAKLNVAESSLKRFGLEQDLSLSFGDSSERAEKSIMRISIPPMSEMRVRPSIVKFDMKAQGGGEALIVISKGKKDPESVFDTLDSIEFVLADGETQMKMKSRVKNRTPSVAIVVVELPEGHLGKPSDQSKLRFSIGGSSFNIPVLIEGE